MRVRIDLLPRGDYRGELVILVDILRSGTVAPLLFEDGLTRLALSASLRHARREARPGDLLIGERDGVPPEGFNYPNSPAALRGMDFSGKQAILVSDNAPRALPALAGAKSVLLGSLYNAGAVARAAAEAGSELVSLVCSGKAGQEDLDDTMAAGFLAGEIARVAPGTRLEGGAPLAIGLLRAFPDPLEALWHSSAGRELRRNDLAEDLAVASLVSQTNHVPRLLEHGSLEHEAEDGGDLRPRLFRFESTAAAD
jgi:2-phosphosulfolactate phosphatase